MNPSITAVPSIVPGIGRKLSWPPRNVAPPPLPRRPVGCHTCEEVCSETWFKVTDAEKSSIRIYEEPQDDGEVTPSTHQSEERDRQIRSQ